MAKAMFYKLDGTAIKFYYGKCLRTPYKENDLWFVHIPAWLPYMNNAHEGQTFLVDQEYTQQFFMDEWLHDFSKWREVAHKTISGDWCSHYECVWDDVPVFEYRLNSEELVKYGYCRTQPRNSPDRELWFVAFQQAYDPFDGRITFVVDHICAKPNFIERMGIDMLKWEIVCWQKLVPEVEWEKLETGNTEGGCVRSASGIALDSPYLPSTLEDVKTRIATYEQEVPKVIRAYKLDGRRKLLSQKTRIDWNTMSTRERWEILRGWGKRTGKKIVSF